jgi:hypothetical protein
VTKVVPKSWSFDKFLLGRLAVLVGALLGLALVLGPTSMSRKTIWLDVGRYDAGPMSARKVGYTVEITNSTKYRARPVCKFFWGSQAVRGTTRSVIIEPGETIVLPASATYPRGLDDYESGGVECRGATEHWEPLQVVYEG